MLEKMQLQCFGMLKSGVYDCIPIKEVRFCYSPSATLKLNNTQGDVTVADIVAGDSVTFTARDPKDTDTVAWNKETAGNTFELTSNGLYATVKGLSAENNGDITVSDGTSTLHGYFKVVPLQITGNSSVSEGKTITLGTNATSSGVTYSVRTKDGSTGAASLNGNVLTGTK